MKRLGLVAVLATLAGCASQGTTMHTRLGVAPDMLFADVESCQQIARTGGPSTQSAPHNPALSSQAGAAFGAGLVEGYAKAQAQNTAYEGCMAQRGYLKTTLTPEERTAFRALRTVDERKVWLAEYAPRDHGDRAIAAPPPKPCKPNLLVACAN